MDLGDTRVSYAEFELAHKGQLELSGVPKRYWQTLYRKVCSGTYDAGESFCMIKKGRSLSDYCQQDVSAEQEDVVIYDWRVQVVASDGIQLEDDSHVYLIDHFFSFIAKDLDEHIKAIKGSDAARLRLEEMLFPGKDESDSGLESEEDLSFGREHIWRLANFYKVQQRSEDNSGPESAVIWFIMDEFGSAIGHSDSPTFKVFPFLDVTTGTAYSVMFPLRSLALYDEVTRDYLDGVSNATVRQYRKLPYLFHPQLYRCTHANQRFKLPNHPIAGDHSHNASIFDATFFANHRMSETLPNLERLLDMPDLASFADRKIKVYTDLSFVVNYLTDTRYELVSTREDADIVWLYRHFKDYEELSTNHPNCFVNQFPFENALTVKDLLASLCVEAGVDWYPMTFNLEYELDRFCHFIGEKLEKGEADEYYWIAKPWNLGRGMDIFICDSKLGLLETIRRSQSLPYIVSRYEHRPLLFYREDLAAHVKFDIRYLLILRSVKPLSAYAYRVFWLRFANKEFNLDAESLHDYATHFTVMNYRDDQELRNINSDEFVQLFDKQFGKQMTWGQIEDRIVLPMLKETVQIGVKHEPPKGIAHNPQSRAIYAVDFVLGWDSAATPQARGIDQLRASMCEVNFCPDLTRACIYNAAFMNDIFATLFLNSPTNCHKLIEEDVTFEVK